MPHLRLGETPVELIRKNIRHAYIRVQPPHGRVRISAPQRMSLGAIRAFLASKREWIENHRRRLRAQRPAPVREYRDGESQDLWGRAYRLAVAEGDRPATVELETVELEADRMILRVRPGADRERRRALLEAWYREQVRRAAAPLLERWQPRMGVAVAKVSVRRMKTRWGSCTPAARSIRLNTELASRPPACLEYVVVHELAHLIEPSHGPRFYELMDRFLPGWAAARRQLDRCPLRGPLRDLR